MTEQAEATRKATNRRIVIVVVVVLFGLALGVYFGPSRVGLSDDNSAAASTNRGSATFGRTSGRDASAGQGAVAHELDHESQNVPPIIGAPSNALPETPKPVRKDYTMLQFQTRSGAPVAGVKILISYHTRAQMSDPGSRAEMETNSEGRIKVPKPADFMFAFRVVPEDWRVRPPARVEQDGWFRSAPGRPVVLDHMRSIEVTVHYADGLPYDGTLILSPYDADNPEATGLPRENADVINGQVRLTVPADYRDFNIAALSRRPGFDPATAAATAKTPIGDRLKLVLERAKPTFGVIEVDLSAFKKADIADLAVFRRGSAPDCAYHVKVPGGGVHATTAIAPGDYTVYVREIPPGRKEWTDAGACTLRTWRSQTVRIDAGQTTRVVAAV